MFLGNSLDTHEPIRLKLSCHSYDIRNSKLDMHEINHVKRRTITSPSTALNIMPVPNSVSPSKDPAGLFQCKYYFSILSSEAFGNYYLRGYPEIKLVKFG